MIRAGIEIHIAMPEGPMVTAFKREGATVHRVPAFMPGMTSGYQPVRNLRKLVNEIGPGLVHSHFVSSTLAMRIALRDVDIPRIFQVPGPLHLENVLTRSMEIKSSTT